MQSKEKAPAATGAQNLDTSTGKVSPDATASNVEKSDAIVAHHKRPTTGADLEDAFALVKTRFPGERESWQLGFWIAGAWKALGHAEPDFAAFVVLAERAMSDLNFDPSYSGKCSDAEAAANNALRIFPGVKWGEDLLLSAFKMARAEPAADQDVPGMRCRQLLALARYLRDEFANPIKLPQQRLADLFQCHQRAVSEAVLLLVALGKLRQVRPANHQKRQAAEYEVL